MLTSAIRKTIVEETEGGFVYQIIWDDYCKLEGIANTLEKAKERLALWANSDNVPCGVTSFEVYYD